MSAPSLDDFKRWSRDCAPAARAVLMARVYAQMERERVDAYVLPIFKTYRFEYAAKWAERHAGPIEDPKDLYLVDDLQDTLVLAFYADCDAAHRARGFKGPIGHCPALTAQTIVSTTENALIDLAQPLFGIEVHSLTYDTRPKYLELLIGACLKAESEAA